MPRSKLPAVLSSCLLCTQVEDTDEHIKTTIKAGGLMDVVRSQNLIDTVHLSVCRATQQIYLLLLWCAYSRLGMHAAGGVLPLGMQRAR